MDLVAGIVEVLPGLHLRQCLRVFSRHFHLRGDDEGGNDGGDDGD